MTELRDEIFCIPGEEAKPIKFFSRQGLKRAYKVIVSDLKSAGVFEPIAYAIREEWIYRGFSKWALIKIEKQFKNLRRK